MDTGLPLSREGTDAGDRRRIRTELGKVQRLAAGQLQNVTVQSQSGEGEAAGFDERQWRAVKCVFVM